MDAKPVPTLLKRVEDRSGVQYETVGRSLEESWNDLTRLGLVALTLKGHEDTLFKTHLSFKSAKEKLKAPIMSPSQPLHGIMRVDISNLHKRLLNQLSPLLEAIFHFAFSDDAVANENKVDKPYLQSVLAMFVRFPAVSYNEVHLEYHSKKHLVGGSVDVVVGSKGNGNKPYIYMEPHNVAIYLGSLLEAKSSTHRLASSASDRASFEQASEDTKALIQPMLELMAISEVAHFPNDGVPLVNIFANKFVYRPLMYFKGCDILLTTPRPLHLRREVDIVDGLGLLFLFLLFQLHNVRICSFDMEKVKRFPRSGWGEVLHANMASYHDSKLIVCGVKPKMPHADTEPFLHPSDEDVSDGEESQEMAPQESKQPRTA